MFCRAALILYILAAGIGIAWADTGASPADLQPVAKSLKGAPSDLPVLFSTTEGGYYRIIGAPAGSAFYPSSPVKAGTPEAQARAYLVEHGAAFGLKSDKVALLKTRTSTRGSVTYVRFKQAYAGVPVFAGQLNAQVAPDGGIQSLVSDILTDTQTLDKGQLSTQPTLSSADAKQNALTFMQAQYAGNTFSVEGAPVLKIYAPSVIGRAGVTQLVWIVTVAGVKDPSVKCAVFVNAHTGVVAFHYSLVCTGRYRRIYDAMGQYTFDIEDGILRRQEGQAPVGDEDVDQAYEYLGYTYDFYMREHGRDSIDGAGMVMDAMVHIDDWNAYWTGSAMIFGYGFLTDDVTAHELTHGVTQYTSDLVYSDEAGALNEALSDAWGEFVDLTNGIDKPADRWLIGEDSVMGVMRNMKDPTSLMFYNSDTRRYEAYPDRYSAFKHMRADYGGVHINSSVINKLCYLLTDGDEFNGQTIVKMDIGKVADLFYEVQSNLLLSGASFYDFAQLLTVAAYSLDFTDEEVTNIESAVRAVEINQPGQAQPLRWLRAVPVPGDAAIRLTWQSPAETLTLVRRTDRFPEYASDGRVVAENLASNAYTDTGVFANTEYFYGIFSSSESEFARATTGKPVPEPLAQAFSKNRGTCDLSYTQLTYDPLFDTTKAYESGYPEDYVTCSDYALTVLRGVDALPVSSANAVYLSLTEDGWYTFAPKAPIPFFGKRLTLGALSSNGYVADYDQFMEGIYSSPGMWNFPSLQSHFEFPRLSFLFGDLSPRSGGVVWTKSLDDRLVFTFERVPEFGSYLSNTVQVELFYSGRLRVTLLEVNAENAVIGLSDGEGVLRDPATNRVKQTDMSELLDSPVLTIDPVNPISVEEGDVVEFTVQAHVPGNAIPAFSAGLVDEAGLLTALPDGAAFDPESGSTATSRFHWMTGYDDGGYHTFRVTFASGGQEVSQDIQVVVGNNIRKPQLEVDESGQEIAPWITPNLPHDGQALIAHYLYMQPDSVPEGTSTIYWYRDNVYMPAYKNARQVPAAATKIGERWHFIVIPTTITGMEGAPKSCPVVTILPDVTPDVNKDGYTNVVDLQAVINGVLGRPDIHLDVDINVDGHLNAIDVQLLVNNILTQ